MPKDATYLPNVRAQYESLPYPPRDPKEEKTRLINPSSERLSNLNHFLFKGRRDFRGFRALVAGSGTGDGTIYLAEQLKAHRGARVVSIDVSEASNDIARQRARIRGLRNITFLHGSLLDLPGMGLEPFDYVNCTGVLHHLADPDAGLKALTAVVKPDGGLGLLVYGRYGRTGVYQMQELMRRITRGETDTQVKVDLTKAMLAALPPSNWFKRGEELFNDHRRGDAGIYDLLLHEQDRAYTVPEVYAFVEGAGLHLVDFCRGDDRFLLDPATHIRDPELRATVARLPPRKQQAVAELMCGRLTKHHFYAAPAPDTVASLDDPDNVPFLSDFVTHRGVNEALAAQLRKNPGAPFPIRSQGLAYAFVPRRYTAAIFQHLDGTRSLGEIFERVRREAADPGLTDAALRDDFAPVYETLARGGNMMLRHKSLPPFPEPPSSTPAKRPRR